MKKTLIGLLLVITFIACSGLTDNTEPKQKVSYQPEQSGTGGSNGGSGSPPPPPPEGGD